MMTVKDLSKEELFELYNKAFTFTHDHTDTVENMVKNCEYSVAPSGSDMFRPELWKDIHWVWFREVFYED